MRKLKKKITTLLNVGIEPYLEGKANFNNPIDEIEELAKQRLEICKGCPFFVDEPIEFLEVEDKNIPLLSGKMCDDCGCTLSYKIRQSITKCDKWLD